MKDVLLQLGNFRSTGFGFGVETRTPELELATCWTSTGTRVQHLDSTQDMQDLDFTLTQQNEDLFHL